MSIKQHILRGLHAGGAFGLARRLNRGRFLGATVLLYHRVLPAGTPADHYVARLGDPTDEQLEGLIRYLKRWFRFSTPAECVERWKQGRELDPYTLLLTIDDGYLDVHDNLLPVLRRCGVPATLFITTGAVSGTLIWPQRLFSAVQTTRLAQTPQFGGLPSLPLNGTADRVVAMESVTALQSRYPADEWERKIDALCEALGWDGRADGEQMMNWSHVEALHRSGLVMIGGHTVTHPLLERCDLHQARREVFDCAEELRHRLRADFVPFSYPQGRCPPAAVRELVRDAGFDCAFTGRWAENTRTTPLYELGRWHVPADDLPRASLLLSGLRRPPRGRPAEGAGGMRQDQHGQPLHTTQEPLPN